MARVLLLVIAVALLGGCGDAEPVAGGRWERLPASPLSPREAATAVAVGSEVLMLGGSDAPPCAPGADCVAASDPPLRDGAAYDPRARSWEPIARAPVGFAFASTAVLGDALYLLVPGERGRPGAPAAFLRYERRADRWTRLPPPPDLRRRRLVATDAQVVAYAESAERGRPSIPDVAFDPATGMWTELPGDPLEPVFGRTMAWSGAELVLFAAEDVPQPGSEEPSVLVAAAFDPRADTWRRLPDSGILGGGSWFRYEGRLILPVLGGADGGEVGNWGRTYPNGGVLDVAGGRWLPLPDGPSGDDEFSVGAVAGERAEVTGTAGWILDAVAGDWIAVPPLDDPGDDAYVGGRAVAAGGGEVIAFGGARRRGDGPGALLGEAWSWPLPR